VQATPNAANTIDMFDDMERNLNRGEAGDPEHAATRA
jgi:hypothetical protein